MKRLLAIITLVVCFGLLGGCKSPERTKQTMFFEWTDAYNRPVSLEKEPQRIVSLSPAITEIVCLVGAQDKLVGVSDFCNYPESVKSLPKMGGMQNINMEALMSVRPDVVLIGSIVSKKDVAAIEKLNIPVIAIREEKSLEGMSDVIAVIGKIANQTSTADVQIAEWKSKLSDIQKKQKLTKASRPSIYYVVGFGDAGDFTVPKKSHIHEIIELAGGRNVGENLSAWNVSREFLFQEDPDFILIRREDYDAFCTRQPYTELSAVKNHKVYPIESGWIDIVSPRNLKAVELLQKIILDQ